MSEPRSLRWYELEHQRLQHALDTESRHACLLAADNARLGNEVRSLRAQAAQATRESEEAFLARALILNKEIVRGRTEAARGRNGVVA